MKSQYANLPLFFKSYFTTSCWHSSLLMSRLNFSTRAKDRNTSSAAGNLFTHSFVHARIHSPPAKGLGAGSWLTGSRWVWLDRHGSRQADARQTACGEEEGVPCILLGPRWPSVGWLSGFAAATALVPAVQSEHRGSRAEERGGTESGRCLLRLGRKSTRSDFLYINGAFKPNTGWRTPGAMCNLRSFCLCTEETADRDADQDIRGGAGRGWAGEPPGAAQLRCSDLQKVISRAQNIQKDFWKLISIYFIAWNFGCATEARQAEQDNGWAASAGPRVKTKHSDETS